MTFFWALDPDPKHCVKLFKCQNRVWRQRKALLYVLHQQPFCGPIELFSLLSHVRYSLFQDSSAGRQRVGASQPSSRSWRTWSASTWSCTTWRCSSCGPSSSAPGTSTTAHSAQSSSWRCTTGTTCSDVLLVRHFEAAPAPTAGEWKNVCNLST